MNAPKDSLSKLLDRAEVKPPPSVEQADAAAWDDFAERVVRQIGGRTRLQPEEVDQLLAPPSLAAEDGEPRLATSNESVTTSRNTGAATMSESDRPKPSIKRPSLKELAERVSKAPPPSVQTPLPVSRAAAPSESAPASLAPKSLAPASVAAASVAAPSVAARPSVAPASVAPSAPASVAPASVAPASTAASTSTVPSSAAAPSEAAAKVVALPVKKAEEEKSGGSMTGLYIAAAGLAAAAGLFFFLRSSGNTETKTAAPKAEVVETSVKQAENTAAPVETAAPAPAPEKKDDGALDLADLASESAAPATEPGPGGPGAVAQLGPDAAKPERPVKIEMEGTLEDKMKETVGPIEEKTAAVPAAGEVVPKNVPDQPPQGSVTAAVGKVMGSAKACVAGADEPSRATITFGSSGAAQNVSVGGWAAKNPSASSCIQGALKGANVGPFSKPTYSFSVTIRP